MDDKLTVREWLEERRQNALTIADSEGVSDPAAWREDADYFRRAGEAIDRRDALRALWLEWLDGMYDSKDLLRRVRLAVHGPLRKPGNAGAPPSDSATTPPTADIERMVAVLREAREALERAYDDGASAYNVRTVALIDRIDAVLPKGTE